MQGCQTLHIHLDHINDCRIRYGGLSGCTFDCNSDRRMATTHMIVILQMCNLNSDLVKVENLDSDTG